MPVQERSKARPPRPDRLGRDEMNLAEFPLAVLNQRMDKGVLKFQKTRTLSLPDGTTLNQEWTVTGDPEYGLPQPVDEDVLLGLLKIAAEDGFASPIVHFTQRGLLAVLHWKQQGWYYNRLEQALSRLTTTTIKAKNAFWNNETKTYQTVHFGIIDSYELYERHAQAMNTLALALRSNMVRFSKEFFSSIQAGYLKPLDLALYFSLKRALTKRLYRYLDKKRFQKQRFEIRLDTLASVHMGMAEGTCRYASWMKKEFDRAHAELVEAGFLRTAEYERTKDGAWKVVYNFNPARAKDEQLILPAADNGIANLLVMLTERGLSPLTAQEIVQSKPADFILGQLEVFDFLCERKSKAVHNPAGFLTRALQNEWRLTPPGYEPKVERERKEQVAQETRVTESVERNAQETERDAVARVRESLSVQELAALREEARVEVVRQLGPSYRLRDNSPVLEAFVYGLIRDRYVPSPSAN